MARTTDPGGAPLTGRRRRVEDPHRLRHTLHAPHVRVRTRKNVLVLRQLLVRLLDRLARVATGPSDIRVASAKNGLFLVHFELKDTKRCDMRTRWVRLFSESGKADPRGYELRRETRQRFVTACLPVSCAEVLAFVTNSEFEPRLEPSTELNSEFELPLRAPTLNLNVPAVPLGSPLIIFC